MGRYHEANGRLATAQRLCEPEFRKGVSRACEPLCQSGLLHALRQAVCVQVNCETKFLENWLTHLVLPSTDSDPSLAAEPGFHRGPPHCGGLGVSRDQLSQPQHYEHCYETAI